MKHIAKLICKALFVIVLFTTVTVALSTNGVNTVSQANAATYNQVYEYLVSNGYTVLSLEPKVGTKYDWQARTQLRGINYLTTINCTAVSIIDHGDVQLY